MLDTMTQELLCACWKSASQAVGGAGGTVGSLARALALDEGVVAEGVAALIGLDYLGHDRYGVVWVTAAGADIVSSIGDRDESPRVVQRGECVSPVMPRSGRPAPSHVPDR